MALMKKRDKNITKGFEHLMFIWEDKRIAGSLYEGFSRDTEPLYIYTLSFKYGYVMKIDLPQS